MYKIVSCNGYYVVGTSQDPVEAVEISRNHVDGTYANIIFKNGRVVGDCVDGIVGPTHEGSPPYDHATATGMYDRY